MDYGREASRASPSRMLTALATGYLPAVLGVTLTAAGLSRLTIH